MKEKANAYKKIKQMKVRLPWEGEEEY